ncbi:hypothetical protein C0Q70_02992 [Pomacea canaliculata]|uniref:Uncharacterized protein n=1 Tax=Pomacea canaliculata TaxID=400727 RepID=A0A2T7PRG8_POMCA|nr:hypothetical protein C0Q70_02992 [Pomacea canaliculata]
MARPHSVKNTWTVLEVSTTVVLVLIRMLIVFVDESQSASLGAQMQEKSGLQPSIEVQRLKAAQTNLLLVTILKQTCQPSSTPTFIVDGTMVSLTVTVTVTVTDRDGLQSD